MMEIYIIVAIAAVFVFSRLCTCIERCRAVDKAVKDDISIEDVSSAMRKAYFYTVGENSENE